MSRIYGGNIISEIHDYVNNVITNSGNVNLTNINTSDNSTSFLTLQTMESEIEVNDVIGALDFKAPGESSGTDAILTAAGIEAVAEGTFSATSNATKLSFKTGASESAAEKMSLSSAGVLNINSGLSIGGVVLASTIGELNLLDGSEAVGGSITILDSDGFIVHDGGTMKTIPASDIKTYVGGVSSLDGLSDAKVGGTNFTNSMIIGHTTTGTLNAAENNVAVGIQALESITTGDRNTAIGNKALKNCGSGENNVAVGYQTLQAGNQLESVAIGYRTGQSAHNNSNHSIFIGSDAGGFGRLCGQGRCLLIGYSASTSTSSVTDEIVIGNANHGASDYAKGEGSNTAVIGNTALTTWTKTSSAHNVAGTNLTIRAGNTTAGTTSDIAGGDLILQGGQGKGTGVGGSILFQTAPVAASGHTPLNDHETVNSANDYALTIDSTGAATFGVGVQSTAHARTATAGGGGPGVIPSGVTFVTVTSNNADHIVHLPAPVVGNIIWLMNGGTGYELRTSLPASISINGNTPESNAESAIGANTLVRMVCVTSTAWIGTQFATNGTESALPAASA